MESEVKCLSIALMNPNERDLAINRKQAIRTYWARNKRKHREMLKGKPDA